MHRSGYVIIGIFAIAIGGVALSTASSHYDIDIEGAIDVPNEEVTYQGDTFELSAYATVEPGDDINVDATAPEDEDYEVQLRNPDLDIIDFRVGEGDESVTFGSGGLDPGTYAVILEESGTIEATHPVVVSGYDLSVSHPSTATVDESFDVTVDLSYGETTEDPDEVEVALYNDDQRYNKTATSDGGNEYTATFSIDESAGTELDVVALAVDEDGSVEDYPNALAVEAGGTVELTAPDESDDDNGDDGGDEDSEDDDGSSSIGGGGGGGDDSTTGNETDDQTPGESNSTSEQAEISVPDVATVSTANLTATENGSRATFNNTPVETIAWQETTENGTASVATVNTFADSAASPPGDTRSRLFVEPPAGLANSSATVTARFDTDQLITDNITVDTLAVLRHNSGTNEWQVLETTATQRDGRIKLTTETPGFSYLAVAAVTPPEARIGELPNSIFVNQTVELTATDSTIEYGTIQSYSWQVGENRRQNETTTAQFDESGNYTVTLTVTGDTGSTDTETATITVENRSGTTTDDSDGTTSAEQNGSDPSDPSNNPSNEQGSGGSDPSNGNDNNGTDVETGGDADGIGPGFGILVILIALLGIAARAVFE